MDFKWLSQIILERNIHNGELCFHGFLQLCMWCLLFIQHISLPF